MNIAKNILRDFYSKKTQAILVILLIAIGTFIYTSITEGNAAMYKSLVAYDASQNTEDYGFILRNKLADEQDANLYDYQKDFISQIERDYGLTVETSFNKMLANETNGHQYRVFFNSGSINKPYIVAGSLPKTANELTVLPEYAKYNNLSIGDALEINGVKYSISGFVYHPAYITPIVTTNAVKETSIYYADKHSIIFMTEDAVNQLDGLASFAYKSKANQNLTNDEKNALFNKMYISNDFEVLENAVASITHGETYLRINGLTAVIAFISILICGSCMFVAAQTVKRRIEADKKQIGTLKALGYKSWEIAKSYSAFSLAISGAGSVVGCVMGYIAYRPLIAVMNEDFNLPVNTATNCLTFISAFAVPVILLVGVCLITALLLLKKSPIELMRDNSDSKVNALGRAAARILGKAPFETRVKFQIACRSVSKLTAMFLTGLIAGTMLLAGLIMNSAFDGIVGKIFSGVNVNNFVTFNSAYNINDRKPQYDDEESALLKDLIIQEARYKNGKTLFLDESNQKLAAIIGIKPESAYINLTDEKGEKINRALAKGLVINEIVKGKYSLSEGDRLLLSSPRENISAEIEIAGIVNQYSGYLAYIDQNLLCGILGYANGSYNSVFTNHQYQLSESRIDKILEIKDFEEGLENNLRIFKVFSIMILSLAGIIAFVIILISSSLVIEENSKGISTFKALGYSSREISNLVINTYTPLLVAGYLFALPISIGLMGILKTELETKFDLPMMLSLGVANSLLGLAVLLLAYFAGLRFSPVSNHT